jgi:formylglycine-generating enzyme required for sulfatase activity
MYRNFSALFMVFTFSLANVFCSGPEKHAPEKMVFAHYMTCFFDSVEAYEYEIALAQRSGIDGFALNCGEWMRKENGEIVETGYVSAAERMYLAAKNLKSDFKLFISVDAAGIRDYDLNVTDMVKRFYKHPNQFRHGGAPVLSTFSGKMKRFEAPLMKLEKEGCPVVFIPNFHSFHRYSMRYSSEQITKLLSKNSLLDGFFNFATDDSINGIIASNANGAKAAVMTDKIYMAGNSPAYNSPNLRDFQLGRGYGAIWEGIIRDGAPWVELTTWNDYQEDSNLAPRTFHQMSKDVLDHDETYLQLTEYYAKWFKTGHAPRIKQDKLFYNYRRRSTQQVKAWDYTNKNAKDPKWIDITREGKHGKLEQIHDDAKNRVYVTLFLKDDASLEVSIGAKLKVFAVKKGVSTVDVPHSPGVPQFRLLRNNKELLNISGRRSIIEKVDKKNSFQTDNHQQNRTWTGGAAVGDKTVLKAAAAKLLPNTMLAGSAVQISEKDGSGMVFPLSGLKTGSYNIRIRYKNSDAYDARLTMNASGSPMPNLTGKPNPYYMPLFLPPTGNHFNTVSVFWSLFEKTDELNIKFQLEADKPWRSAELTRLLGDRGSVLIEQVELIYVPALEEQKPLEFNLVRIPGGSFTMGTDTGNKDESPAHKVTLSPFAISKYELTNAEFEAFNPKHRQYRDGHSWRDNEPVIYTSWRDIAKYCNWLSKKHGLEQVYNEKTYAINLKANGFRMPTEAEWEYVATGRGEAREYPWGNEKPQSGVHGNFIDPETLDEVKPNLRSSFAHGAMVVGSYSSGASRDGVLDLAGNVGEWCLDTYLPYTGGPKNNPLQTGKSHSHVMRGGTWTYYNYSQRSRDREFNSQGYPGFAYVGARLVVSEAGYNKLMKNAK